MDVKFSFASNLVDKFEELLSTKGISIPKHHQTSADMLPLWYILKLIRAGFAGTPDALRGEFTAAVAVHDLAAKVLDVSGNPQFDDLIPHLQMLSDGAVHLTEEPPADADTYNKMIEIYWASLCLSAGLRVQIDDPKKADGKNPDVITLGNTNRPLHGYAFKTVRSAHTQNILEHIVKGIDQIERSAAVDGIVALHLTPRMQATNVWPTGGYFTSWTHPAIHVMAALRTMVSQVVIDNGQPAINKLFAGKKAIGWVLCIAFCPTVAAHPVTGAPTVMPLKVATLIDFGTGNVASPSLMQEIALIHEKMQLVLG